MSLSKKLKALLSSERDGRHHTINLNASENYTSSLVKNIIGLHPSYDFYQFPPSAGTINGPWKFNGTHLQQLEEHLNFLAQTSLNCEVIDSRPKGGQAAEIAVLLGLAHAQCPVFYVAESDGGHFGLNYLSEKLNIPLVPLKFNDETFQLNAIESLITMRQHWKKDTVRKLIMIGQSYLLRSQPLAEFTDIIRSEFPDVIICYDVSHVLGLIVGDQFANPVEQGIDLIHGSTHKTFPGPQKAIIAYPNKFNSDLRAAIQNAVSPGLQSNCGTSEMLALAVAFEEMIHHGRKYATATCHNAKQLAQLLESKSFMVAGKQFGFTETHQVWVVIGDELKTWGAFSELHAAGIRCYPACLPHVRKWGLRFGTNAITRLGFSNSEISLVANWIKEVLIDRKNPATVFNEVKNLMGYFPLEKLKYSLNFDAHRYQLSVE